jgi:hypothetical protein
MGDETPAGWLSAGGRKEENRMADLSCVSTGRSSSCLPASTRKAPVRVMLAVATLALAGCNANQTVNPASQRTLADIDPNYSPYDPTKYAQTSGFYAGR